MIDNTMTSPRGRRIDARRCGAVLAVALGLLAGATAPAQAKLQVAQFPATGGGATLNAIDANTSDNTLWAVGKYQPGGPIKRFAVRANTAGSVLNTYQGAAGTKPLTDVAVAADGSVWATDGVKALQGGTLYRLLPGGTQFEEFPLPVGIGSAFALTRGPDGQIWVATTWDGRCPYYAGTDTLYESVVRIDTASGQVDVPYTRHILTTDNGPSGCGTNSQFFQDIASGPDGAVWVSAYVGRDDATNTSTAGGELIRVPVSGPVTRVPFAAGAIGLPPAEPYSLPYPTKLTRGVDGALWLGIANGNPPASPTSALPFIGRMNVTDGTTTAYPLSGTPGGGIVGVGLGGDNAVWYVRGRTSGSNAGRATSDGVAADLRAAPAAGNLVAQPGSVGGPMGGTWTVSGNNLVRINCSQSPPFGSGPRIPLLENLLKQLGLTVNLSPLDPAMSHYRCLAPR